VLQEVAQLQAQVQAGAARVHELEAQLEEKVQWQARLQGRLDKHDELLKMYRREKWDRKKYKDTLLNMSIHFEVCFTIFVAQSTSWLHLKVPLHGWFESSSQLINVSGFLLQPCVFLMMVAKVQVPKFSYCTVMPSVCAFLVQ
jgi:hypothetical protein